MFSLLDRYLLRETTGAWLGVTGVLLLILTSSRFARFLGEAAAGELVSGAVFNLLGLAMIGYLGVLIPVGLLFGILLALGRLYRDSEMTVLMACGYGPRHQYRALFWLGGALALVLAVLALYVNPWAARQSNVLRGDSELQAQLSVFEAGRFKGSSDGEQVFYAGAVANNGADLQDVFINSYEPQTTVTISAARGSYAVNKAGTRQLILNDGYRYAGRPGSARYDVIRFAEHGMRLDSGQSPDYRRWKRDWVPTAKLWQSDAPRDIAELQWRFSIPLSVLVLTLLAVPLARSAPRQGRYGRLLAAILVYVLYSNLLNVGRVWLERGEIPVVLGLWWVHGIFVVAGLLVLAQQNGWRPWRKAG